MPYRVFNVGDRVRIRSWDNMADEFGDRNGYIPCDEADFVEEMRHLCGRVFTITAIRDESGSRDYKSDDEEISDWMITGSMLEPVPERSVTVFAVGDLVRVRQWEDMAEEFGMNGDSICCDARFVDEMRYLCGKEFVVSRVQKGLYDSYEYLTEDPTFSAWRITGHMLELVETDPVDDLTVFDPEDFLDALTDCVI